MNTFYTFLSIGYNLILTYCIYKFYSGFSSSFRVTKKVMLPLYGIYFIFLMLSSLFIPNIALRNFLLATACVLIALTHFISAGRFFLSTVLLFSVLSGIEFFLIWFSAKGGLHLYAEPTFNAMTGKVLSLSLIWLLLLLILICVDFFQKKEVPLLEWLPRFCLPASMLLLSSFALIFDINRNNRSFTFGALRLLTDVNRPNLLFYFSCIGLLFCNILLIYMCDRSQRLKKLQVEQHLVAEQNQYYENQFAELHSSEQKILGIKHDMKNHLAAICSMMNSESTHIKGYLDGMLEEFEMGEGISSTGNILIDGLINYKFKNLPTNSLKLSYLAAIPIELPFDSRDLTTILGNLIDNAIDATTRYSGKAERCINLELNFQRNSLIINISNPFDGELRFNDDVLITTKKESQTHGFGLKNVKRAVEKNKGSLSIQHNKNSFSVCVIMTA